MQKMSEKEAVAYLKAIKDVMYNSLTQQTARDALDMAIAALEEIQQYRALEQRLQSVYGEHDGLLEIVINGLAKYENAPDRASKAVLLIDDDVDKWKQYRAIGTVDQCREAVERMKPKKPIEQAKAKDGDKYVGMVGKCPACGGLVDWTNLCCDECFQRLDWSE